MTVLKLKSGLSNICLTLFIQATCCTLYGVATGSLFYNVWSSVIRYMNGPSAFSFLFIRKLLKNGYFTVRLTVKVDPLPPLRSAFREFLFGMSKKKVFFGPQTLFQAPLVGQNFAFTFAYSQGRRPPPSPLG